MPMKKVYIYLPYGENFEKEKQRAKNKGAVFDKFSKTWYFNIEVGESLNKLCRGFKIKNIENPPTFEEVLAKKNIVTQKFDDPFDEQSDNEDKHAIVAKAKVIPLQKQILIKKTICKALDINIEYLEEFVQEFLNSFKIEQINEDRFTLHYLQFINSKRFCETSTYYDSYDQVKAKCVMIITDILQQLNDFDETKLAEIQHIKRDIYNSIGIAFSRGEIITDLKYGCQGYDRNIIHNLDGLKFGLSRFLHKFNSLN